MVQPKPEQKRELNLSVLPKISHSYSKYITAYNNFKLSLCVINMRCQAILDMVIHSKFATYFSKTWSGMFYSSMAQKNN